MLLSFLQVLFGKIPEATQGWLSMAGERPCCITSMEVVQGVRLDGGIRCNLLPFLRAAKLHPSDGGASMLAPVWSPCTFAMLMHRLRIGLVLPGMVFCLLA